MVTVDDNKFDRFITGVPRQYEAVVFFTAAGASYKCTSCRCYTYTSALYFRNIGCDRLFFVIGWF